VPHTDPPFLVLGTAPLAGLYTAVPDDVARITLDEAWAAGIRRFDTAPHYGAGAAERRLGDLLARRPVEAHEARISTKVGRTIVWDPTAARGAFADTGDLRSRFDFGPRAIREQLLGSLTRLGVERVDTVFLHDPDERIDEAVAAVAELQRMRSEGMLARIGVGTNRVAAALDLLDRVELDVVMIAGRLTLLDDSASRELLPRCADAGAEVWAAGVFNGGILADPREGSFFDYRPAPPATLALARRMEEACARHGVHIRDAAVRLPGRHPEVDAVVLGVRTPVELTNALAARAAPIPDDLWAELTALLTASDT
jgi:D-threo-aldose 1-dehydrogenase